MEPRPPHRSVPLRQVRRREAGGVSDIDRLIAELRRPDPKMLETFWLNSPTPFEASGEDEDAARSPLRAIAALPEARHGEGS